MTFEAWAWQQCMVMGHEIVSIKDTQGENIKWVNTTTEEEFLLMEDDNEA